MNIQSFNVVESKKTKLGRFEIVQDIVEKDGVRSPYSYVIMREAVGVLCFFHDKIVVLKQFRYMENLWNYEFPGGMIDDGENAEKAAVREVQEETGLLVKRLFSLGFCYPSLGATNEKMHLFVAFCEDSIISGQTLDAAELIDVEFWDVKKFKDAVHNGVFNQSTGLALWTRYSLMMEKCECC